MAVLQFKLDESYDNQIMVVGGWIGDELEWKRLESTWQRRINFENRRARPDQQITRFHATEMNCKAGEYKNWDKPMCLELSKKLISLIAKRRMGAIAVACDMDAIRQVFPKGDAAGLLRRTYILCMKTMMVEIANIVETYFSGDSVLLVHDRNNWDDWVLQGYNLMVDEPGWSRRSLFEGILSKTGKDSIGLQAADMIAYEVFKGVKAKTIRGDAEMRGAMREFLKREVAMSAKWINLHAAEALYGVMQESGKYPNLDEQGIT